ncbi:MULTISPECIES: hypothetical protein [Flavobacteriaceae]|jgi:hypothetical protein|uniref:DUF4325 domain-containing protein n=1 Tax=Christiangramia antarctica TaxID=2058158 RepID=A0ABW5X034_9FLAO|nr:hypothetical protein [Gramella sp. AN32]MCM4156740.1 DUF4325 domain-containing protein [Gramella sp. AN32]|tara:strand:- start:876 stop:1247 length:372 start_codon:yes stop_codon:yes gene_type:complete
MIIDLAKYKSGKSTLFTGRPQGKSVREKLDLDSVDTSEENINVIIPKGTSSINPSFFLGLFFPSIKTLGSEKFKEKYKFKIEEDNPVIEKILKGHIEDALRNARNTMNKSNSFSLFKKSNLSK